MTDNDLLIVSITGAVAGVVLWLAAKYTVWRHKKALAARAVHPAE